MTSSPFSALAGLACENEKAATNVVTSFNRKTRAGKGKRGASRSPSPSVRKTPRRSKEAEAPAIALANLVAEPEVGRSETETEEASVQPALPTGERGGEGEEEFLPVVSVTEGARVTSSTVESGGPSSPFSCDKLLLPRRHRPLRSAEFLYFHSEWGLEHSGIP